MCPFSQELEIELNEAEPLFLRGQTKVMDIVALDETSLVAAMLSPQRACLPMSAQCPVQPSLHYDSLVSTPVAGLSRDVADQDREKS